MTATPAVFPAARFACGALVLVTVASTVGLIVVAVSDGGLWDTATVVLLNVSFALVGALVVWRQQRNTIGWLFLVTGAGSALGLLGKAVGTAAVPEGSGAPGYALWLAWFSVIYVELLSLPIVLTLLLFPDGRLLSRRWRPVVLLIVVNTLVGATIVAVSNQNFSATGSVDDNFPGLRFPLPLVDPALLHPIYALYQAGELVAFVVGALSLVLRYRRSGTGVRAQIRWVMFAAAAAALGFVLIVLVWPDQAVTAFSLLFSLVPLACGAAILRYRLYDIDRLISRTLSYLVVTGVVVGVFVLVVAVLTSRLPASSSPFVVAAATLGSAALFRPLLRRVRAVVDRRFDRARFDAAMTVDAFGVRLQDQLDPDATADELISVVRSTLGPSDVALLLRAGTVER